MRRRSPDRLYDIAGTWILKLTVHEQPELAVITEEITVTGEDPQSASITNDTMSRSEASATSFSRTVPTVMSPAATTASTYFYGTF